MGKKPVTVYGAYGHTGKFVVAELVKRGWRPRLAGRDGRKLEELGALYPELETYVASPNDDRSVRRALEGSAAVLNCAGPFLDTAAPLVEASLETGTHYLDVMAEQRPAMSIFENFHEKAIESGVILMPAVAFYGGLADLVATYAMGETVSADEVSVAYALDSWKPTNGTRITGERNTSPRLIYAGGRLEQISDHPIERIWEFPEPFKRQAVKEVPFTETILIARHLPTKEIRSYLNLTPLKDVRDPATPPPELGENGRSAQVFAIEVKIVKGDEQRHAAVSGNDIYAVTAPIVVEAMERILDGRTKQQAGAITPGQTFDAGDFLRALEPDVTARGRQIKETKP